MDLLYPLKFKPIYKERIWGGRKLETMFSRSIPEDTPVGESWELSDYPNDGSEIINGKYAGKFLSELIQKYKTDITGTLAPVDRFPLLIKILDAADRLSVQVHPDDKMANEQEGYPAGKTEMWFVLEAEKDAAVVCGMTKDVSRQELEKHITGETLAGILKKIPVQKEDVVFIPSKTVHAILPGMLLLEVQQTSDITYRLYDWGRIDKKTGFPRELHIEKGISSSNLTANLNYKKETVFKKIGNGNSLASIVSSEYFSFDRLKISQEIKYNIDGTTFYIFFCLSESCTLKYANNTEEVELKYGELVLVPACLSEFAICGKNAEVACIYLNR